MKITYNGNKFFPLSSDISIHQSYINHEFIGQGDVRLPSQSSTKIEIDLPPLFYVKEIIIGKIGDE